MDNMRGEARPSGKGQAAYLTSALRINPLSQAWPHERNAALLTARNGSSDARFSAHFRGSTTPISYRIQAKSYSVRRQGS